MFCTLVLKTNLGIDECVISCLFFVGDINQTGLVLNLMNCVETHCHFELGRLLSFKQKVPVF